ncbi:MAG: hypothetical protein AAF649_08145 [Verrucomicrobiota bacterium]
MMTTQTKNHTCAQCIHWNGVDADSGECRRQPPQAISFKVDEHTRFEARFPVTAAHDWCGEFAAQ